MKTRYFSAMALISLLVSCGEQDSISHSNVMEDAELPRPERPEPCAAPFGTESCRSDGNSYRYKLVVQTSDLVTPHNGGFSIGGSDWWQRLSVGGSLKTPNGANTTRISINLEAKAFGGQTRTQKWKSCGTFGLDRCRTWKGWNTHFPTKTVVLRVSDNETGSTIKEHVIDLTASGATASNYGESSNAHDLQVHAENVFKSFLGATLFSVTPGIFADIGDITGSIAIAISGRKLKGAWQSLTTHKPLALTVDVPTPRGKLVNVELFVRNGMWVGTPSTLTISRVN